MAHVPGFGIRDCQSRAYRSPAVEKGRERCEDALEREISPREPRVETRKESDFLFATTQLALSWVVTSRGVPARGAACDV